jgi:penicillin-binding protein 1C
MNWLHRSEPSWAPKAPVGVAEKVLEASAARTQRVEWFLEGTETAAPKMNAQPHYKIVYPADGTVMALDPDIPSERQKVFFEAQPLNKNLRWMLNGDAIGAAGAAVPWSPVAGKHALALIDQENRVVDRVSFSVRGRRDPQDAEEVLKVDLPR